ncbi:hypothetical protein [Rhodomicrobium lacus]|uniref:hypothetical protein n=1 Tax=Rhodomicrobium lacus TaxID=2498452 RepID=UPI0026E1CAC5|nr:hypothetical protein [Rhodomicrobium lacus]WKW52193.1 hypothetical protein QMO75_06885 [Rhodomicrobium lacus]
MRKLVAWTMICALALGLPIPASPVAFAQTPRIVTIDECRNLTDTEVRDRIRELATTSLKTELTAIDYMTLVNQYWAKADVNARIDREIDAAVEAVRADSSWADRAYSTISQSRATLYATAVAERAYTSQAFRDAINELATGVAKEAATRIEKATSRISNPIIACVQTALQSRYGGAVAQVFAQESQRNLDAAAADQSPAKIETGDLVATNAGSISGLVLIVTRRVIGKIVQSVGTRVAGMVASRIVSSVAGLAGLALIAKDIYDAGDGVFPIIAERMKSDETKLLIKEEIGKSIQTDIGQQVEVIADETAERIYTVWLDFRQKYNRLLALSEKSPAFADFLKNRRLDQIGRLGQIVDIVSGTEGGEAAVLARVANGSLNRALLDLSDAALVIAEEQKSIDKALRWTQVAGRELPRVVELGVYRWLPVEGLTTETLQKILAINDRIAVGRIANLSPEARDFILSLPGDQVREFARRLNDRQLAAFADYERNLEPSAAKRLLRAVTDDPSVMRDLTAEGIREGILGSRDQLAALEMMLQEAPSLFGYGRILKDAALVSGGNVAFRVFWERYWLAVLVGFFLILVVLSWLRRLLFGRPQQIVIREQGKSRTR